MTERQDDSDIKGGYDVFGDIGIELSVGDRLKISIARAITNVIVKRKLTQQQAADIIGCDQPKISHVTRGHVAGMTADRLMMWLLKLGYDLELKYRERHPYSAGELKIEEVAAA